MPISMKSLSKNNPHRFWELDAVRGLAIVGMVIYHLLFDLVYFSRWLDWEVTSGGWRVAARLISSTFLILVGISLWLSYQRLVSLKVSNSDQLKHFLKRSFFILGWAALITVVTALLLPGETIIFGILHLIGVSIMISFPFLKFKKSLWPVILVVIALGWWLRQQTWPFPYLVTLGFTYSGFRSLDYFPLFPWLGLVLTGIELGKTGYMDGRRQFLLPRWEKVGIIKKLAWLGQYSLASYLIHQPVLLASLWLIQRFIRG